MAKSKKTMVLEKQDISGNKYANTLLTGQMSLSNGMPGILGNQKAFGLNNTSLVPSLKSTVSKKSGKNNGIVDQYNQLVNATGVSNKDIENYGNNSTPAEKITEKAKNKGKGGKTAFTGERLEVAQKNAEAKLLAAQNIKDKIQMNKDQLELDNKIRSVKFGKVGMISKGLGLGASIFSSIRRGH